MKTALAVLLTVAVLATSTSAEANSDRNRGIVYGVLGTLLVQEVHRSSHSRNDYYYHYHYSHNRSVAHVPHYSYRNSTGRGGFPPFRCSGDEIRCAYERGRWERELQEWQDAKNRAYWCGRDPRRCD